MKKIKYILLLFLVVLLTGCSKYNMSMKIDKDKRMDFIITILSNYENSNITNNINIYKEKLEQYGYSVNEYNVENKYGMVISKKFDNIDDISNGKRNEEFDLLYLYKNDYNKEIESKMFNVEKGFDTNRYAANFFIDLTDLGIDLTNSTVTYSVEVPNKTISNNANLVSEDGNSLTWNITSLGKKEIDFVFEIKSYDYIYFGAAILIALFLFFSIISTLFSKSGEENNSNKNYNNSNDYDLDRKIQNLTNNAVNKTNNKVYNTNNNINNNTNKQNSSINNNANIYNNSYNSNTNYNANNKENISNNKLNENTSNSINLVPQVKSKSDDISNFKAPEKQKKKGLFGIFKKEKKITNIEPTKINTNEEFNAMIENINKGNINVNSEVKEINNKEQEEVDYFESIDENSSINVNNTLENNNDLFNVNPVNEFDSLSDINSDTSNNALDINNIDVVKEEENIQEENFNTSSIRLNSKSIEINNDKKDE